MFELLQGGDRLFGSKSTILLGPSALLLGGLGPWFLAVLDEDLVQAGTESLPYLELVALTLCVVNVFVQAAGA